MTRKITAIIVSMAFVVLLASNVFAWTTNPIRAGQDGGGSWRLTTIPEHAYGSFGKVPFISMIRKDNTPWKRIWPLGDLSNLPVFEEALKNIDGITKALDKIISSEEVISVTYYLFINEVVIYLHPDRWKDKEFHEDIARKFNKLRKGVIK